ncbi:hypothetical protein Y032_0013g2025 [Ancylostoma ceylanicum]|uniref:EGF-like domain-containing protein n=1 Tax=Ancylostoma ceylanicum TaxID=53326 RepID=A0A016VC95_9BILA|nr:hypothetical protein Y032_0013g2025 [Ancylostoma ceylanicum]
MFQPASSSNPCAISGCQWMCVSIPNAEGEMQPECLCPDGYEEHYDGDCIPIEETAVQDARGQLIPASVPKDHSHVGVAWMKERCLAGDGCLNGGQCQDIKNEHGRVTKIICSCESPYEGIRCERMNPEKELARLLATSSRPIWMTLLFTIIFLALIVAAFFISYRYIDVIR